VGVRRERASWKLRNSSLVFERGAREMSGKSLASVFVATSVDGYIARLDGGLDWLPGDDECEPHGYDEFVATVDAHVIGRKTLEIVLGFGGWAYGKKPVVVLSKTMTKLKVPKEAVCELMSGTPKEIVKRLSARGLNHLYVDGGVTVQGFLNAGLIQRLIITRIPVLLGSGIPLFGFLGHDIRLKHVATRSYPSGLVQSEYTIGKTATRSEIKGKKKPHSSQRRA
jgi:dihydrofolate reductase